MSKITATSIVAELIRDDPSLAVYESELQNLVLAVIKARPEVMLDPSFKASLRQRLLETILQQKPMKPTKAIFMKKAFRPLVFGGVFLLVAAVAAGSYIELKGERGGTSESGRISITKVSGRAFGALRLNSTANAENGRDSSAKIAATSAAAGSASTLALDSSTMVAPADFTQVVYVYKGNTLTQRETSLEVLKRVPGQGPGGVGSIFKSSSLNLIASSIFEKAELQNISFTLKGESYRMEADFINGRISINNDMAKFQSDIQSSALTKEDVPGNEEMISIASAFMSKFGISTESYGKPVAAEWKASAMRLYGTDDASYVPSEVNVTYPLLVQGRKVYDTGGGLVGITVGIDVRTKKVTNVQNIFTTTYEGSMYDAETNMERIMEVAKAGGTYQGLDDNSKKEEAELGSPELAYLMTTTYNGTSQADILVPAYMFPVTKKAAQYSQDRVVVPLISELLEGQGAATRGGSSSVIEPMPAALDLAR